MVSGETVTLRPQEGASERHRLSPVLEEADEEEVIRGPPDGEPLRESQAHDRERPQIQRGLQEEAR
jgi:hypothetical protein